MSAMATRRVPSPPERGVEANETLSAKEEGERVATYAKKLTGLYPRTEAIAPFDPDGTMFMVDIADIVSSSSKGCEELDFVAFGCHGTGAASLKNIEGPGQLLSIIFRGLAGRQKTVGDAIVRFMEEKRREGRRPFGFVLGDNFYESGIPNVSPESVDELFEKAFVDIYNAKAARRRRQPLGLEYFGALGNHDYNFHGHAVRPLSGSQFASHLERALAQVDASYRRGRVLGWNLPYRYYCAVSPIAFFFVIDTSTFLFDERQQDWLRRAYEKLSSTPRFRFLIGHHGFVSFGRRGAADSPESDPGALDLRDDVNRHIFDWFIREGMHFHFNVVAHDHFLASALLAYAPEPGLARRTQFVLSGGGGAWLGEAAVEALAKLGQALSHIDLIEQRYGFAHFRLTREAVELNFRVVDGKRAWDAWQPGEQVFRLGDAGSWSPTEADIRNERRERPMLRGVLYEPIEGALSTGRAYRRRYFELDRDRGLLRFGDKPGKLARTGITIDPRQIEPSSCSFRRGAPRKQLLADGIEHSSVEFRTRRPRRGWRFAVPSEIYADFVARLESALPKT